MKQSGSRLQAKFMVLVLIVIISVVTWWIVGINTREKTPSRAKLVLIKNRALTCIIPTAEYNGLYLGKIKLERRQ